MDSDSSDTNLVIVTRKYRLFLFWKLYWRSLVFLLTPLILLPVAFIGDSQAYSVFFVFLVSAVYWATDALHPTIISLVPLACYSVIGTTETGSISQIYLCNGLLDCLGIMMIMTAVESSWVHRRAALKLLLIVGCSHYRLSLVLFFGSMFLSMWISNTAACGIMMPFVKALLQALEKMGIVEMYQTIGKAEQKSRQHETRNPIPTDFTVFYFLGIAYSCSIGGMATLHGTQTNQIFRAYCESIFPKGPKIEFPQYMLLNLPGVLMMETLLYIWMNSYFLNLFRTRVDSSIQTMSEEESRYINTLLENQYSQLGKITLQDKVVIATVLMVIGLQISVSATHSEVSTPGVKDINTHVKVSAPSIIGVVILFVAPTNLEFLKFFRRKNDTGDPLPTAPSKACLNWQLIRANVLWSVLFTIGGSCLTFETLTQSGMTAEFGRGLRALSSCPELALVLVVAVFCKIMTELASNSCVAYALLPEIATLSVQARVHPHRLMLAATLASSMPSHLPREPRHRDGQPVRAYTPKEDCVGPSMAAVVVTWFTATVWSNVIWIEAKSYPDWAEEHTLQ